MSDPISGELGSTLKGELCDPLETSWRAWHPGKEPPHWQHHLPSPGRVCTPEQIFLLIQIDIEFRARHGLPGLLEQCYLDHPRLQEPDTRLNDAQQVELIGWEYQKRWLNGDRARREEYLQAFPQHALALSKLRPRWNCPSCRHTAIPAEGEATPTLQCPGCGSVFRQEEVFRSRRAAGPNSPASIDLRHHELLDALGAGGMGEVYRARDPGLDRDLAIKVIHQRLRGHPEAEARFVREARVTGALQHPCIVPVHNLGRLADGRLFFTMKLVQGRTLHELLRETGVNPASRSSLLSVFEKICQGVAYAHSRGVIHRDLKPANVMVGQFGEVQVMDWGLAKELAAGTAGASHEQGPLPTPLTDQTHAGAVLGTPSYMAPEQARGEVGRVDARSDVFALGAILCVILTGKPPFANPDVTELLRQAREGQLSEAQQGLDRCGADAELIALCKECLAPDPVNRPANAEGVATRLAVYRAGVEERLRQAEVEQARARVQALEARKRQRLTLALAAALVLLIASGAGLIWWKQQRQAEADRAVTQALVEAELLSQQAEATGDLGKYRAALAAARNGGQLARTGGASQQLLTRANTLIAALESIEKDLALLAQVLDVRGPREGVRNVSSEGKDQVTVLSAPRGDDLFPPIYRSWGLDVENTPIAEAAARLKSRPPRVVLEVIAALDDWSEERRRLGAPPEKCRRLTELAAALDDNPDPRRRELRAIMARERLPLEASLSWLSASLRPVPIPALVPVGTDHRRLLELARQIDPGKEPVLGVLSVQWGLRRAGEAIQAEGILRAAVRARPGEVVLHHALAEFLAAPEAPRWRDVVECYTAARAVRPELGMALSAALLRSGRREEALALLEQMVREEPGSAILHFLLADCLVKLGKKQDALRAYRRSIELDPGIPVVHNDLGVTLHKSGDSSTALECFRRAVALAPRDPTWHVNLGVALLASKKVSEAVAAHRKAVELAPHSAEAHFALGATLDDAGASQEAVRAFREAIRCDPRHARSHHNLANHLYDDNDRRGAAAHYQQAALHDPSDFEAWTGVGLTLVELGNPEQGMKAYQEALRLNPRYPIAHQNLGNLLRERGAVHQAIAHHRQAIELDPGFGGPHYSLGRDLWQIGEIEEALLSFRRAIRLLREGDGLRAAALAEATKCERILGLEQNLSEILKGERSLSSIADALVLAQRCQKKQRYQSAVLLLGGIFKASPSIADDRKNEHRYNAARCALLSVAGQDATQPTLAPEDTARFRQQARDWLRQDLALWRAQAEQPDPQKKNTVRQTLELWERDPALAPVREPKLLQQLPEKERSEWVKFWQEVMEVERLAGPRTPARMPRP